MKHHSKLNSWTVFPTAKIRPLGFAYTRCRLLVATLALGLAAALGSAIACDTVIPPPSNLWEAQNVYVLDKDTNSVFINANELYLRSIHESFPEIVTLADLIGKDDYYFYPTNLADKYRADDARVIASGVRFETIEENQTKGGEVNYVYVSKTPLRDAQGQVCALRIMFYVIPPPGQTVIPSPANDWQAAHVVVIDKNTNSVFINANDLFLASLRAAFPEIQSVTNLIGRNDYAFYPTDLAEKYRADDARVLSTGRPLVTIEPNQAGSVRLFYHVRKEPLTDSSGRIFGLRITSFALPANEQALLNNFRGGTSKGK